MIKFIYGIDYEQICSEVKIFTEQFDVKEIQTLVL